MHAPRLTHPSAHTASQPLGWRRDGRPIMPILGAEDDPPKPADPPPKPTDPPAKPKDGDPDDSGTDWKASARKWETQAKKNKDAADELAKIKADNATDQEKAVTAAKNEVQAAANKRVVRAEVRAQAAGTFTDPSDAPLYVDLDSIAVDDDGEPDVEAIGKALKAVLKSKPHLAKAAGKSNPGDPGFGPGGATPGSKEDYAARIAAAEKAGDVRESVGLKTASLFGSGTS